MIDLRGVTKTYQGRAERQDRTCPIHALQDVDLTIAPGEFVAIMGPSGSGKSTLLSLMGLLSRPTSGSIWLAGQDVTAWEERQWTAERAERIGFVFQFPSLVNTLNVRDNILLPKLLRGRVTKGDRLRADELLQQVGLSNRGHDRSFHLSGGEQRRVAMARALIGDPALVLADEPTGALDEATAAEMMQLFCRLQEAGKTVVMVTHDRAMTRYANRTVKIQSGVIQACSVN